MELPKKIEKVRPDLRVECGRPVENTVTNKTEVAFSAVDIVWA